MTETNETNPCHTSRTPMSRLFGHLATKFGRSSEDLATEALCYILQSSEEALRAFVDHLNDLSGSKLSSSVRLATQKSTDEGGRPDLVGWGQTEKERLFVEAKFWAGLTSTQPVDYLASLPESESSLLLFLVPERRRSDVWREVLHRAVDADLMLPVDNDEFWTRGPDGLRMAITTWSDVLDSVDEAIPRDDSLRIHEDLRQLRGLCDAEGAGAFRPFRKDEFSPHFAQRVLDLHQIVKALQDSISDEQGSLPVTKNTGFSGKNYRFEVDVYGHTTEIGVRYWWWANRESSPFWFRLHLSDPLQQQSVFQALIPDFQTLEGGSSRPHDALIPLDVAYGVERVEVIRRLHHQVKDIAERLRPILTDAP